MTTVYKCDEEIYPSLEFGCLEKVDNKYCVQLFNSSSNDDLLFATPVVHISHDLNTESVPSEMYIDSCPEVLQMMEHYKSLFLEQAVEQKKTWFSRDFDNEMLADLWKDSVKHKTNQIKLKVSTTDEEHFTHFSSAGERLQVAVPKGSPVKVLIRLESLWFSRSNFGATYTALQSMQVEVSGKKERTRPLVREKLIV